MSLIFLLFAAGVILLGLEVVVPGAVLGIIGGIFMLAGVIVAFERFGINGGGLACLAALLLAGITVYLEFVLLPKSRLAKTFSMTATVDGTSQPALAGRAVIGRTVSTVTPLTPSGFVEFDGRRYEAFARSGQVDAGVLVEIVDLDNFRLIVSKPSTIHT